MNEKNNFTAPKLPSNEKKFSDRLLILERARNVLKQAGIYGATQEKDFQEIERKLIEGEYDDKKTD